MKSSTLALVLAALCTVGSTARAVSVSMDLPFDLSTGTYNPAYGDTFYNAPGYGTLPSPVTLHTGDAFHVAYHYLPGQALQVQNAPGAVQQLSFDMYDDFIQGIMGTFTLKLKGVKGDVASTTYNGVLDGQNFLYVGITTHFTDTAFSFTGFDIDMNITGMRASYGSPVASSFTAKTYEFQAYGGHVLPEPVQTASVPDAASTSLLLAGALGLLFAARRRVRAA